MKNFKKNILIVIGCYLPGFKAGGPIRTISNLVENLGDDFNFKIITADRDLGDAKPYDITLNQWHSVGKAEVIYISKNTNIIELKNIINNVSYDLIYLNSIFNFDFTIKILVLLRLNLIKNRGILLAPRGELSNEALYYKRIKKLIYLYVFNFFNFFEYIVWHATTEYEKRDISKCFISKDSKVLIAQNISSSIGGNLNNCLERNVLMICFISRISPIKNLIFALEVLSKVEVELIFDIYGPIEDKKYWEKCLVLIKNLPSNIICNYCGSINNEDVHRTLCKYNILFVPSRSENYGHIYSESLSVGTVILVSKNTPWLDLEKYGVGWDIDLKRPELFIKAINSFDLMKNYSVNCINYMNILNRGVLDDNIKMLNYEL